MSWRINWDNRPVVYRCYSADGRLLYVGSTYQLDKRMTAHLRGGSGGSFWAPLFHKLKVTLCATELDARELEKRVIRDEAPRFNIRHQRPLHEMTREQFDNYIAAVGTHGGYSRYVEDQILPYVLRVYRECFPQAVMA